MSTRQVFRSPAAWGPLELLHRFARKYPVPAQLLAAQFSTADQQRDVTGGDPENSRGLGGGDLVAHAGIILHGNAQSRRETKTPRLSIRGA